MHFDRRHLTITPLAPLTHPTMHSKAAFYDKRQRGPAAKEVQAKIKNTSRKRLPPKRTDLEVVHAWSKAAFLKPFVPQGTPPIVVNP